MTEQPKEVEKSIAERLPGHRNAVRESKSPSPMDELPFDVRQWKTAPYYPDKRASSLKSWRNASGRR